VVGEQVNQLQRFFWAGSAIPALRLRPSAARVVQWPQLRLAECPSAAKTSDVESPDVRYTQSGDAAIAYYVVGDGPRDLVFAPFMISAVFAWELLPVFRDFCARLASFSRLILFDRRGIGASDRPRTRPTLEGHMEDVRAVLDTVSSEQAVLFGSGHGGQMCALFAAAYPERTSALVLYATSERAPGTEEEHRAELRRIRRVFGLQEEFEREVGGYPSLADDEAFRRAMSTAVRASTSPGGAVDFLRTYFETDISDVLPLIRIPTLVLYRSEAARREGPTSVSTGEADARRLAGTIPDARVVPVPGPDHSPFVGADVTNEVERFLGSPHEAVVADRVLATVLFTDLVASTERIASLGDRQWREVLEAHHSGVRRELALYGGVEIDTAGDGFFCRFDGPARAIACAQRIVDDARALDLAVRAGIHTGECEIVGEKIAGIAVATGARISALAESGEVLVSRTVRDLVAGSGIEFVDRGEYALKGVPGTWQLFKVAASERPSSPSRQQWSR
jgi:class 3 adenylate cyclase